MSSPHQVRPSSRAPRADAARNRSALLAAARSAFATSGDDASLEGIARQAGVGIGTLYRNFPTREDLVAAVYAAELDAVVAASGHLLAADGPTTGLRAWLDRYAAFVAAKRGMAETVRAGSIAAAASTNRTRERVNGAIQAFLSAGAASGELRGDVPADDVTTTLVGIFLATRDADDDAQRMRLLDFLVEGLRRRD